MISVRKVHDNELEELIQLAQTSFVDTYAFYNTEADMEKYLRENFTVDIFKEQIDQGKLFFVAIFNHKITGYIQLSHQNQRKELGNKKQIEIERLYVAKEYHGQKIGSQLIEHTISFSSSNNFEIIWLGVWKNNFNAIEFYKKLGFEIFGEHHFILGDDVQDDWLMKKDI